MALVDRTASSHATDRRQRQRQRTPAEANTVDAEKPGLVRQDGEEEGNPYDVCVCPPRIHG